MFKRASFKLLIITLTTVYMAIIAVGCSVGNKGETQKAIKYPEKPIQILVGFAAGGPNDKSARLIAPFLEKQLGQPVSIVNKPGGAGEVAFVSLAHANPDGYTLSMVNFPNVVAIAMHHKTNYTLQDFGWLGNLSFDENVIVAKADGSYRTIEDLIIAAKKNPEGIIAGHSGPLTDDQLAGLVFEKAAGVKFRWTPFQGSAPSITALLGGHIEIAIANVVDVEELAKDKKLIVLATMGEERNPKLPDVPTLKEKGINVVLGSYRALAAPAKVPPEILSKLREEVKKAVNDPEYKKRAKETNEPVYYIEPEKFDGIINEMSDRLKAMDIQQIELNQ